MRASHAASYWLGDVPHRRRYVHRRRRFHYRPEALAGNPPPAHDHAQADDSPEARHEASLRAMILLAIAILLLTLPFSGLGVSALIFGADKTARWLSECGLNSFVSWLPR